MRPYTFVLTLTLLLLVSCSKETTKYRELLNGTEVIYPGQVYNLTARPGNLRALLQWQPSPDPTITGYIIYWNNNIDSLRLPISGNAKDTVSALVSGMKEYVQNFVLYTTDDKGNKSVGRSLSGVRVYGPLYVSSLVNRQLNAAKPPVAVSANTYVLYFSPADTSLNVNTRLTFNDIGNHFQVVNLSAKNDSVILGPIAAGAKVAIRSSFIPAVNAIDTFNVSYSDTLTLK